MERHYAQGRHHLLTEDVVRFATITLLEEYVPAADLQIEVPLPGPTRGKLDLAVRRDAAIEFKFPRDPRTDVSAADTMTLGEMLADIYRLAALPHPHRLAVWLLQRRLTGYLTRTTTRLAIAWPNNAGDLLTLPAGLRGRLPATAAAILPPTADQPVTARLLVHAPAGDVHLLVLAVTDPPPPPWPPTTPAGAARAIPPPPRGGRGARHEILDAIDAITTRSGHPLFTVQDVTAELERRHTTYALSTITTMITSHMCIDSASVTQWPDLRRVDRGVYRRLQPEEQP